MVQFQMTLDVVLGRAFDKEAATFILGELVRGYSCSPQVNIHTLDRLAHMDPMEFPPKVLHSLDNVGIEVLGAFMLVKIDKRLELKFHENRLQQQNDSKNRPPL